MASDDIRAAQSKLNARVMGKTGVEGTAIGLRGGKPCLKVYVSDPRAKRSVPSKVDGFRVVLEKTGSFRKL